MDLVVLPVGIVIGDVAPTQQTLLPHLVFLRSITNRALIVGTHAAPDGHFEIDDVPIGDFDAFDDPRAKTRKRISVTAGTAVTVSFP
jgi:hypothetical protein